VLVAIWPVLAIYVAVAACRAPSWCGARWGSVITSRDGRWWWVADMDKRLAVLGPHVHEGGVAGPCCRCCGGYPSGRPVGG